jgi:gliding motility-associated-like protein
MKKIKNVFKFHSLLSFFILIPFALQSQNFGQFASAIIMDTNVVNPNDGPQGIQDWFCLTQCDPNNPNTIFPNSANLNGANFGNRIQFTNSLQLDGAEIKTFKNPGANVCGIDIYYRFYLSNSTPPAFQMVSVNTVKAECSGGVFTDGLGPCNGSDQKWQVGESFPGSVSPFNIDLTGVCGGIYLFEVYFIVRGSNSSTTACNDQVIVNNNGNNFIATYNIQSSLTANISAIVPTCAVGNIQFQANNIQKTHPGAVTFLWTGPNNYQSTDQNPSIPANTDANGTYTCVITDPCGLTYTETVNVLVNPLPEIPVSGGNLEVCESSPINAITATAFNTDGSSIVWYDAPIGGNIVNNPTLTTVGTITYYAEGVFTSTGCVSPSRTAVTLTIIPAPNPPSGPSTQTFCSINNATIAELVANGNNILWYDSPNSVVALPSSFVLQNNTTYYASQTINGCESIQKLAVLVIIQDLINPIFDFSNNLSFCFGASVPSLPNTSNNGITGTWSPSVINNTQNGTYIFTPNAGSCSNNFILQVNISPVVNPTFDFSNNLSFCSGASVPTLPNTSNNGIAGTWSPSVINNTQNGTYVFTPNAGSCSNNFILQVNISPVVNPTFDFSNNLSFCSGASVPTLPNTSNNGITGTWSPSVINNTQNGTYVFTPNAGSCSNNFTLQVNISPVVNPTFDFSNNLSFCSGASVPSLPNVSNNGITGTWSPSVINNTQNGTYIFTPINNCASTFTLNVEVVPTFDFEIGWRCAGKKFELFATDFSGNISANQANFSWSFQNTTVGNNQYVLNVTDIIGNTRPINFPLEYQLIITNSQGCNVVKTYQVTAIYCDIQKGISPNSDGLNDFFDLQLLEVDQLSIFNRWGVKVYEKQNYTKEWMGQSSSGSELPDATYFYHIRFKGGEEKTGWIYLNREAR